MKMRPKHFLTAMALTLAALLVLSSATQVATAVVCIGPDGHIDIESIFQGCCSSGPAGARSNAAALSATGSDCGDCTDVQLKAAPLRPKQSQLSQPDNDEGSLVISLCSSSGLATPTADAADMDQHWQSLAPLTTVVLLT
jgi:hypothetical protein